MRTFFQSSKGNKRICRTAGAVVDISFITGVVAMSLLRSNK